MNIPKKIYIQTIDCPKTGKRMLSSWCEGRIEETDIEFTISDGEEKRLKDLFESENILSL